MAKQSLDRFRNAVKSAKDGLILKPHLTAFLVQENFPAFTVDFGPEKPREPDGWFHPSTHPLWTERQLYHYLTSPERITRRPLGESGAIAVTVGKVLHVFLQACMEEMGLLIPGSPETGYSDEATRARGAIDGLVSTDYAPTTAVWDFKTSNAAKLQGVDDLDLLTFIKKWPGYYAQQQEYLRLSGYDLAILTMHTTSSPWTHREFHIPRNDRLMADTADKYRRVLAAVESGREPIMPCCNPGSAASRECPAATPCPNGTAVIIS